MRMKGGNVNYENEEMCCELRNKLIVQSIQDDRCPDLEKENRCFWLIFFLISLMDLTYINRQE